MSKRAVILAGGRGTRLRPYTVVLPKPLMPIGEYPILEVIVRQLCNYGFDHLTFAVNHQADLIKAFFQNGARWNIRIDYSLEQKPLSTIGPLALVRDLPEHFLLMNGDVLTDLNLRWFLEHHSAGDQLFTIAAAERTEKAEYGVLHVNGESLLTGFEEKPVSHYLVSMGIYALSRGVLDLIPPGEKYGFDDLMLELLSLGKSVRVHRHTGYWLDIGRPDDYMRAIDEFDNNQQRFGVIAAPPATTAGPHMDPAFSGESQRQLFVSAQ